MNIIFILALNFSLFTFAFSFIAYPFVAQDVLSEFYKSISRKEDKIGENLMKHRIPGEFCKRECKADEVRICYFKFIIRYYQVMSGACNECKTGNITACLHEKCVTADGFQRGFLSINFLLPGPAIHVCKNDILIVDVLNEAEGTSTSIHWHGIRQMGSQFNDGVPYLTQCPIDYNSQFRYIFRAEDVGTHFYHSHSGNQKADGLHGVLIVREPDNDNLIRKFYDHDLPQHFILATDWMHSFSDNFLPGMIKRSALTESMLINGYGRYRDEDKVYSKTPIPIFYVQKGKRFRFRLINSATNVCPYQFQIESHNFTIIATELSYVEPFTVDTLHYLSGERYDIVIDANQPVRDYWIRIRETSPCWKEIEVFAILRYQEEEVKRNQQKIKFMPSDPPEYEDEYPKGRLFNSLKPKVEDIPLIELKSLDYDKTLLEGHPDYSFHLFVDSPAILNDIMYQKKNLKDYTFLTTDFDQNKSFVATINNVTLQYPQTPLLLEKGVLDDSYFCNGHTLRADTCIQGTNETVCKCIHRLKVKLNSNVEFVVYNLRDKISHPMHLHGHKFHIIDQGMIDDIYTRTELNETTDFSKMKPTFKDTAPLSFPGYVRFRFRANNPGFWLYHCHFDWHISIGMALILQVGELEEIPDPPDAIPRCHPYLPISMR